MIAHQRHLLLPLTSPQVLHDNPLLNAALLRILTVGNVLNNSSAMGSAAGCVRDRCSTHHAAAHTARWRLQRMMFVGRFEIACLADLAKLQGNAPDSSMLRSGAHAHAHTHQHRHFLPFTPHCQRLVTVQVHLRVVSAAARVVRPGVWRAGCLGAPVAAGCRAALLANIMHFSSNNARAHTHVLALNLPRVAGCGRGLWRTALAVAARV